MVGLCLLHLTGYVWPAIQTVLEVGSVIPGKELAGWALLPVVEAVFLWLSPLLVVPLLTLLLLFGTKPLPLLEPSPVPQGAARA